MSRDRPLGRGITRVEKKGGAGRLKLGPYAPKSRPLIARRASRSRLEFRRDKFAAIHSRRARVPAGGCSPHARRPLRLSSPSFRTGLSRRSDCKVANLAGGILAGEERLSANLLDGRAINSRNRWQRQPSGYRVSRLKKDARTRQG